MAIKKSYEPTVHLGDRYKSNNTPLNPDPSDESHCNFHFLFETAVYLSHSISISTMTRYPNKRCLDSSLHWSLIIFYQSQPNHQSKKHQPGLNLQCPIPLSVLPAPSLPSQGLNITQTPLWSGDSDVIKKDSYQPVLITTILSDAHYDQSTFSINDLESSIIQRVPHSTESKKSPHMEIK